MKHNIFKRTFSFAFAALAFLGLTSCEDFGPVFTGKYDEPDKFKEYTDADFEGMDIISIKDLKAKYKTGNPFIVEDDIVIKGQVSTSDKSGNLYKSFYIQDETAGIEVKMGKTGLYNDYKPNQWIYIKCKDLAVGAYNGMVQIGYPSDNPAYETAYMEAQLVIDQHVFKGEIGKALVPKVLSETEMKGSDYLGMLCTIEGLKYGKEVFAIVKNSAGENVYLSDDAKGVTTWAMTKAGFQEYLKKNQEMVKAGKQPYLADPTFKNYPSAAITVSQYFRKGSTDLQVRTSGYAKFADAPLKGDQAAGIPDVTEGTVSMTGILTVYKDNIQFTLIDLSGVKVK